MRYVSTRGGMEPQLFCNILLAGLAPDGGLAIPESYPQISIANLEHFKTLSYAELAFEILSLYISDIPANDLRALCLQTYTAEVYCNGRNPEKSAEIAPVYPLEKDLFLLELSNGPTLAFKDMAMQMLGNLFEYVLNQKGEIVNIVGATSGDTGSAAEYAMRGKKGINVFMLSPKGRMSPFQRAQMFSLQEANIFNIAVPSMFDGCQDMVKAVNRDSDFKRDHKIGAVNSINWSRIVAQVVYYFKGYLSAVEKVGEPIDVCVPSGNFGNVCAAHIAKQMGLPLRRLVVATNENDVLDEFFKSGIYRPRANDDVLPTSSPSMDISKASNLERFVFDLVERNPQQLASLWKEVEEGSGFELPSDLKERLYSRYGFISQRSTHANRITSIQEVYEKYGVEIDTHTADGYFAAKAHREVGVKMLIAETALAAKFEESIVEALGRPPQRPEHLQGIEKLPQRSFEVPADAQSLKQFITKHL